MEAGYNTIDLARHASSPGDGARLQVPVEPGEVGLGGQVYEVAGHSAEARVDVSRTASGYALRLRFAVDLQGPCMRCLEAARVRVEVDAREVDQAGATDEDLRSPYVADADLDLGAWAHDALVLALPVRLLCRPDCLGLCPTCGASLNDADPAEHEHERPVDPRWAKLSELKLD